MALAILITTQSNNLKNNLVLHSHITIFDIFFRFSKVACRISIEACVTYIALSASCRNQLPMSPVSIFSKHQLVNIARQRTSLMIVVVFLINFEEKCADDTNKPKFSPNSSLFSAQRFCFQTIDCSDDQNALDAAKIEFNMALW